MSDEVVEQIRQYVRSIHDGYPVDVETVPKKVLVYLNDFIANIESLPSSDNSTGPPNGRRLDDVIAERLVDHAAEIARMRPVVEAARKWTHDPNLSNHVVHNAVRAYENTDEPDELPPHPGCGDPDCMMDHDWFPGTTRAAADEAIAAFQRDSARAVLDEDDPPTSYLVLPSRADAPNLTFALGGPFSISSQRWQPHPFGQFHPEAWMHSLSLQIPKSRSACSTSTPEMINSRTCSGR
jgi:hypothetical protein